MLFSFFISVCFSYRGMLSKARAHSRCPILQLLFLVSLPTALGHHACFEARKNAVSVNCRITNKRLYIVQSYSCFDNDT
jgi:hypothetical protein